MANFPFFLAYVDIDCFCIVMTVIAAGYVRRDYGSETQVRYFFVFLTAYLTYIVADLAWAYFMFGADFAVDPLVPMIAGLISRTSLAAAGYFWYGYTMARFESVHFYSRKWRWTAMIPAFLTPVIYVEGYLFGLNTVTLPGGMTAAGPTSLIIDGIMLLYLIMAAVVAVSNYRHTKTNAQRRMCVIYVMFMLPPFGATILEMFLPDMPFMALAMMVSILLVLLSVMQNGISNDALTGLNNRRRADEYLMESVQRASHERPVYLFIIDMNRFKEINDTFGHLEGDRALQLMATALRDAGASLDAFVARWGGDEFVMICCEGVEGAGGDPARVPVLIDARLHDVLEDADVEYDLSCSVGFAKCDAPAESYTQLMSDADQMLYRNK